MDTIFVSGIPKGLDCGAASLLIKKQIRTVAQVERVFIQKEKGFGFITLYDVTSIDTVLSLEGNSRKKTGPPDSFSFCGYNTYSAYRRDEPQPDILYKYAKPVPPRRLQKRKKSRKESRCFSSVPVPKADVSVGRICKTKNHNKQSNKTTKCSEIKCQPAQRLLDDGTTSTKRHRTSFRSRRQKQKKDLVSLECPILPTVRQEIERSETRPRVVRVHVYCSSKYLYNINVDNNNTFESICTEILDRGKVPLESLLLTYNGKLITRTWPVIMEEHSNIHTVVKGNGGMMKAGNLDESSKSDDSRDKTSDKSCEEPSRFSNWNLGNSTGNTENEDNTQYTNDKATGMASLDVTSAENITSDMTKDAQVHVSQLTISQGKTETLAANRSAPHATSGTDQNGSTLKTNNYEEIKDHQLRMINKYGLQTCLLNPLMFDDVMYIKDNDDSPAKTFEDVPRLLLRNLMMLDYTARENVLYSVYKNTHEQDMSSSNQADSEILNSQSQPNSDDEYFSTEENESSSLKSQNQSDSDDDSLPIDDNESTPVPSAKLDNPLDVFQAIFACLHPSLQQKLVAKMFVCRLAIPLIYHTAKLEGALLFSLWPLRTITVNNGASLTSIVNCKQKIVSLVRLGRPPKSKSEIANALLLEEGSHPTFYNYECDMGSSERPAFFGLVEASWFLPSEKKPSMLKDVTLFLNLRGDGFDNTEQLLFLKSISHVLIVLIDKTSFNDKRVVQLLKKSSNPIIFIVTGEINENYKHKLSKYFKTKLQQKLFSIFQVTRDNKPVSISEVRRGVVSEIVSLIDKMEYSNLAQVCESARQMHIHVDEDSDACRAGRENAQSLTIKVNAEEMDSTKCKFSPLQSDFWLTYSKKLKTYEKANHLSAEKKGELGRELYELRNCHYIKYKKGNEFMDLFIKLLLNLENEVLIYFIDWLKFYFDENTREKISKNGKMEQLSRSDCKYDEKMFNNSTFGVEHIFRELGQIYLLDKDETFGTAIAKAMVKVIKLGYPFELMDGDAINIPIPWIKHVFHELKETLGDVKILTLSVIGLQSSGKSTLLNAMFGISLAVSAGRCTRGIYMQLLPVKSQSVPFEYVLVVDTEGLRAPQLSNNSYQHDNELATFVIGIADITVINVKGENTSEVKDILNITVHAFLRLQMANENLKLRQSCICIHQNVPADEAKACMIRDREAFIEVLNKMTAEAAKEENICDVKCFNDVIEFDNQTDIWYFSDVWKGDPPMAPANPGYHLNVETVRKAIFDKGRSTYPYRTLTDTFQHLNDLWNGILANDFVFFFKNSFEIKANNAIDKKIRDLVWKLECFADTLIKSSYEEMQKCAHRNTTKSVVDENKRVFNEKVSEFRNEIIQYFQENEYTEIIAKWRSGKMCSWEQQVTLVHNKLTDELQSNEDHYQVDQELEQLLQKRTAELTIKAKELADSMQETIPNEEEIVSDFDSMWNKFFDNLNEKRDRQADVKDSLNGVLLNCFPNHQEIVQSELTNLPFGSGDKLPNGPTRLILPLDGQLELPWRVSGNTLFLDRNIQFMSIKKHFKYYYQAVKRKLGLEEEHSQILKNQTNTILREIYVFLADLSATHWKFNETKVKEISLLIKKRVTEFNSKYSSEYTLLEPYTIKVTVHVFVHALPIFNMLDAKYRESHGIEAKIKKVKSHMLGYFRDVITKTSAEKIASNRFCEIIEEQVEEYIRRGVLRVIYEDVVNYFHASKRELIKHILVKLAHDENFDRIIQYIQDPYTYSFEYLKRFTDTRWFDRERRYREYACNEVKELCKKVETVVTGSRAPSLSLWLKCVVDELQNTLPVYLGNMSWVQEQISIDMDSFQKTTEEQLGGISEKICKKFQLENENTVTWYNTTPYDKAMKIVWGCKATCPFCNEPCQMECIHEGTPHECVQHRALGINGWKIEKSICLIIDSCSFNVQSTSTFVCGRGRLCTRESDKCSLDGSTAKYHPYRDYKKYAPDWTIHPCSDISSSRYWAWTLCKYNNEFANHYNAKPASIPFLWNSLTKTDAVDSLNEPTQRSLSWIDILSWPFPFTRR